jgi:hypothetical protein
MQRFGEGDEVVVDGRMQEYSSSGQAVETFVFDAVNAKLALWREDCGAYM